MTDALDEDSGKLSNDEKKARAESMLTEMREALKKGTELLGEARAAKDIVQLNCVNEKLIPIKGLLKISEGASVRMYEGMAAGTPEAAESVNHEYTKLAVAHQKVLILRAEADQCVGESTVYAGDTEIKVDVDPTIAIGGDTSASGLPFVAPNAPPVASKN